jgi:hypothetical protein
MLSCPDEVVMMRDAKVIFVLAAVLVAAGGGFVAAAEAPVVDNDGLGAVERVLLEEDLQKMSALSAEMRQADLRLRTLYRTLDDILGGIMDGDTEQAGLTFRQIQEAEARRRQVYASQRNLVNQILARKRKLEVMEEKFGKAGKDARPETGILTGTWTVVLLPKEQHGAFTLVQTGTLVSGTYRLAGGWNGSLQGTLVNRKVYLVRIDSKLGRSMEFEGAISSDGKTIRGVWLNYDLGSAGGAEGQWSATRTQAD